MSNQSKLEYMIYKRTDFFVEKYKLFQNLPKTKEIKDINLLIN